MKKINDFDRSIERKHGYRSYKEHFKPLYMAMGLFCVILLGCSAFFSAQFFAGLFSAIGAGSIYIGIFVSGLVAIFIGLLTDKALVYYDAEGLIEPVLGVALVGLIGLNAYGDLNGARIWGSEIVGQAPTDKKTGGIMANYQGQIAGIDEKIDAIEAENFYWCSLHNARHKCDNPANKRYVNKAEKSDRKALLDIDALEKQRAGLVASMDTLVKQSSGQHAARLSAHSAELAQTQGRLQGASIICMGFYLLLSFWRHGYGKRALSDATESPSPTLLPEKTEPEPKPESEKFEAERQRLENEMELLREELRATKEAGRDYFDGGGK